MLFYLITRRYNKKAKTISKRYRDQPKTPAETAVFWVEYVIRHRGASHLRSAGLDLSWMDHSVDVFGLLLGIIGIILYSIILLISRICCRKSTKSLKKQKKA